MNLLQNTVRKRYNQYVNYLYSLVDSNIVTKQDDIRVVELFAGVGGFRVGLERASEHYKTIME